MKQKGFTPILAILIIGAIAGSIYLATKYKDINLSKLKIPEAISQIIKPKIYKVYKNDVYHFSVEYPNNAYVFAPSLEERELLEKGRLSESELTSIQFRTDGGSFLFTISVTENPSSIPIREFLINRCAQAKKEGDSCAPNIKYEDYKMPNGTSGLIASNEWYAEAMKKDSLQRTFYFPLDKKFLSISFATINQGDIEAIKSENTIINSLKFSQ